jgi:hypothetical protein
MGDTYLLYIDILGFAEMTRREPRKVARIYAILDSLNVHRHGSFKTIIFSDTVLVYNPAPAKNGKERAYLVWYLIEFAEDLHHRLTGQDIFFRAVLTTGNLAHYNLKNIECFFGEALVNAYLQEKQIPSIGLFIDSRCNKYNQYFRVAPFDNQLFFVYLNRSLENLNQYTGGRFPIKDPTAADQAPHIPWQVHFLRDIHTLMRKHPTPQVRTKFLTAWDFYKQRYPEMLRVLEQRRFSLSALAQSNAWRGESSAMRQDIRYFRRIGSGSSLSLQLTRRKRGSVPSSLVT